MAMTCPKCGYLRKPEDDLATAAGTCPACGVIYAKFTMARAGIAPDAKPPDGPAPVERPAEIRRAQEQSAKPMQVVVVGMDIPFWQLVEMIFRTSLAAIPAMLLLAGVSWMLFIFLAALGMAFGHR